MTSPNFPTIHFSFHSIVAIKHFVLLLKLNKFKFYGGLSYDLAYGLSLRLFCVYLISMYIVLLLDGVFYQYLLGVVGCWSTKSYFSLLIFCLIFLSIIEGGCWSFQLLSLSFSSFIPASCCLIYFGALLLDTYVYNCYSLLY